MFRSAVRHLLWLSCLMACLGIAHSTAPALGALSPDRWTSFVIAPEPQVSSTNPAVYDNKVAFAVDNYDELLFDRVAVHDLNSGETRVLAHELPGGTWEIDIYGDWVVSVHDSYPSYRALHAFNLTTDEHVVIDPGIELENYYPAIDDDRIVWVQVVGCCSSDVLLYDLTSRTITPVTDDGGANYEYYPHISGDWVIWHQGVYPEWDIIAYNLVTSEKLTLTDRPFLQMGARIDGTIVVWKDITIPGQDADIIGYDLNTRQTFPVAVGPAWQDQPYVHDGFITWVQIWGLVDHDQIWGQDVGSGDRFLVYDECPPYNYECPTNNGGPVSYDNLVVWIESSGPPEYDLILRGARRLTQQTFLPLARH